jgi:hypothetical protein
VKHVENVEIDNELVVDSFTLLPQESEVLVMLSLIVGLWQSVSHRRSIIP